MKYDWYNTTKTALACLLGGVRVSWLAYGLSLLMIFLAYGQARGQNKSQQIKQGETPAGIDANDWASIQKQMQMSKYKAYPQQDGSYTSANLVHGLQIEYAPEGKTTLLPRDCNQADYQIAMQLQGIGYDKLAYLDRPAGVKQEDLGTASGSKVTYQWNANLREWWVNDKQGLEQWFSLQEAPQGRKPNTPLHLRMALQTDMHVTLQNNHLQLQKGNTTLHYDKLKVWDATGKEIAASMNYTNGYIDLYVAEANATYPLTIDPTWTQQAYIKASNTNSPDSFGDSVAISGETIVVGATQESSNATGVNGNQADNSAIGAGAAYIFVRNGTTWTQQAYLKASNTGSSDFFGASVAISGETVVVGAWGENSNATGINGNGADNTASDAGAAYVFVRNGTTWTQQAYLKASNTNAEDMFSKSVAISGETVVVGADREASNATGVDGNQANNSLLKAGAVYIFVRNGTTWTQQAYLKASNTGAGDYFGRSVAMSGETLAVGADGEASNATGINGNTANNSATDAGAVYIFVRNGTTWSQQAYLKASNTEASDYFGHTVAISGETVVVGAWGEDSNATGVNGANNNSATDAGAVYIFVRNGTTWSQQAYLKASNTGVDDEFGWSVAISGETVVVGAPEEDSNATGSNGDETNNSIEQSGAVYVFVRSGTTWTQQTYLKASNTGTYDRFGYSVAILDGTVIVGAYGEASNATGINGNQTNNGASLSGAVYVFSSNPSPEINLKRNTTSIASAGSYNFGTLTVNQSSGNITFTIENTGSATLNLTGTPKIVKSGTHANDFIVTETLPATINASGSANFTINFTPSGLGTRTAQISIANNDGDENPYIINLTGLGNVSAPAIAVKGNGNAITNGSTTPSATNHTNFANWTLNTPITRTFTIENTGTASLNITSLTLTGADASAFSITQQPATTIPAGQSTTFTISHTPTQSTVAKNATVNIANNSAVSPFTFAIRGSDIALSVAPRLSVGKVEVYPNPAKKVLTISLEGNPATEIAVTLLDAQGKPCLQRVLPVEAGKAHLRLQGIASGLHILHVQVGKEWITEKIMIEK
jgi:hypothetical protein